VRRALVVLGAAVLAVAVAAWLAVVEVLWLPLRAGGVLVPVSVPAAVVGNLLLVAAAHRLSGSRLVAVLPALVWGAVALAASTRRAEGDLLVVGGGAAGVVNLAFLLLGVVAAAFAVGRVLAGPRPGRREPPPAPVSAPRAGSGTGGAR
jgi:hypothetical protein